MTRGGGQEEPAPFDDLAADYDRTFTDSVLGRLLRDAVWRRLDVSFRPGDRVLELGCGTGEDAVYLGQRGVRVLATDAAPAMLGVTRAKVVRSGLEDVVEVRRLPIEELAAASLPVFDGALSNFGGLNCVADLRGPAVALAACLRRGARAVLCLMGPCVPWEWAWFLLRGQPARAFRRLRPGGVCWRGLRVHYPTSTGVRRAFAANFQPLRVTALGALVPPPYAEAWAVKHPRLLAWLNRCERRLESFPGLAWLADHYLLELERR